MNHSDTQTRVRRLALWGEIAVLMALTLMVVLCVVGTRIVLSDPARALNELNDYFDVSVKFADLGQAQFLGSIALFTAEDMVGVAMMIAILILFRGFRREGVFTQQAGKRLRLVGGLLVAIMPVGMVSEAMGSALLTATQPDGQHSISLSLQDTDVYAILLGLTVLVTGHILAEAARISEENKGFV